MSLQTSTPAFPRPQERQLNGWIAFGIGAVLLCGLFAILALNRSPVDVLVEEDGPVEWLGAIGLFAGSGLFAAAGVIALRRGAASGKSRAGAVVLLAMGVALFFLAGEEISWGQRLFGWGTPEALTRANAQSETNLHNLNEFQGTLLDGDRLFRFAWVALFVVVPLGVWLVPRVRVRARTLLPVAPLWLAGLFVLAYVLTHLATRSFESNWDSTSYTIGSAATEIQEASVELLMGVAALMALLCVLRGRDRSDDGGLID